MSKYITKKLELFFLNKSIPSQQFHLTILFKILTTYYCQFEKYISGFLVSIIVFFPSTGKLYSFLPSRTLSLAFLLILLFREWRIIKLPKKIDFSFFKKNITFISILIFLGFILFSANQSQYDYFLNVGEWLNHRDHYVDAKLVKLSLSIFPSLICIYFLASIENTEDIQNFCVGLMAGFLICALILLTKISTHLFVIASSDYMTSRSFYVDKDKAFSIVSSSPIIASASAILFTYFEKSFSKSKFSLRTVILFTVFIFCILNLYWLKQRADFIICVGLIIYYSICKCIESKKFHTFMPFIFALFIVIAIFCYFKSSLQSSYWSDLLELQNSSGVSSRLDAFYDCFNNFEPRLEQLGTILFGNGLGSFFYLNPNLHYPHNILLEALYEVGLFSFLIVLFLTLASMLYALRIIAKSKSLAFISCSFIFFSFIIHSFKSDDFSSLGQYFFLILLLSTLNEYSKKQKIYREK